MANEPPSTLHSKRRVVAGSLLVKLKAIESKPVVAPLLNRSATTIRNFGCKCCNGRRSPVDGPCKDRRRVLQRFHKYQLLVPGMYVHLLIDR